MPQVFKIGGYWVYFWSDENKPLEPVHVHIAEGKPMKNIIRIIEARSSEVLSKWESHFGEIRFYC